MIYTYENIYSYICLMNMIDFRIFTWFNLIEIDELL